MKAFFNNLFPKFVVLFFDCKSVFKISLNAFIRFANYVNQADCKQLGK